MEVKTTGVSEISILGHIKSIEDYHDIKVSVRDLIGKGNNSITINVPESLSMTSSVIGFLLKLVYIDKVDIAMRVRDERLYDLLDILNLITAFNVTKMK
ncbi:MAG: hypothetical protein ABSB95_12345 [Dissulfurispiraceae bacterium]|jgi:hypothetical protein